MSAAIRMHSASVIVVVMAPLIREECTSKDPSDVDALGNKQTRDFDFLII